MKFNFLSAIFLIWTSISFACPVPKQFEPKIIEKGISVVCHDDWTSWYDTEKKTVLFSFYTISKEKSETPNVKRPSVFTLNPSLEKSKQAKSSDYNSSGYDRGHLFPNDAANYSIDVVRRSFYMTNIVPQTPSLNRGIWNSLEKDIQQMSIQHGWIDVYILSVYSVDSKWSSNGHFIVPDKYLKILVMPNGTTKFFLFNNEIKSSVEELSEIPEQFNLRDKR